MSKMVQTKKEVRKSTHRSIDYDGQHYDVEEIIVTRYFEMDGISLKEVTTHRKTDRRHGTYGDTRWYSADSKGKWDICGYSLSECLHWHRYKYQNRPKH